MSLERIVRIGPAVFAIASGKGWIVIDAEGKPGGDESYDNNAVVGRLCGLLEDSDKLLLAAMATRGGEDCAGLVRWLKREKPGLTDKALTRAFSLKDFSGTRAERKVAGLTVTMTPLPGAAGTDGRPDKLAGMIIFPDEGLVFTGALLWAGIGEYFVDRKADIPLPPAADPASIEKKLIDTPWAKYGTVITPDGGALDGSKAFGRASVSVQVFRRLGALAAEMRAEHPEISPELLELLVFRALLMERRIPEGLGEARCTVKIHDGEETWYRRFDVPVIRWFLDEAASTGRAFIPPEVLPEATAGMPPFQPPARFLLARAAELDDALKAARVPSPYPVKLVKLTGETETFSAAPPDSPHADDELAIRLVPMKLGSLESPMELREDIESLTGSEPSGDESYSETPTGATVISASADVEADSREEGELETPGADGKETAAADKEVEPGGEEAGETGDEGEIPKDLPEEDSPESEDKEETAVEKPAEVEPEAKEPVAEEPPSAVTIARDEEEKTIPPFGEEVAPVEKIKEDEDKEEDAGKVEELEALDDASPDYEEEVGKETEEDEETKRDEIMESEGGIIDDLDQARKAGRETEEREELEEIVPAEAEAGKAAGETEDEETEPAAEDDDEYEYIDVLVDENGVEYDYVYTGDKQDVEIDPVVEEGIVGEPDGEPGGGVPELEEEPAPVVEQPDGGPALHVTRHGAHRSSRHRRRQQKTPTSETVVEEDELVYLGESDTTPAQAKPPRGPLVEIIPGIGAEIARIGMTEKELLDGLKDEWVEQTLEDERTIYEFPGLGVRAGVVKTKKKAIVEELVFIANPSGDVADQEPLKYSWGIKSGLTPDSNRKDIIHVFGAPPMPAGEDFLIYPDLGLTLHFYPYRLNRIWEIIVTAPPRKKSTKKNTRKKPGKRKKKPGRKKAGRKKKSLS